ncbi:MAG: alpha/beta hydrolase [Micrococcales bacterium]|nr:alpha/beta hydrolase [Micrococcales bacterium]MCL2668357.1 alpha/beta hydrolase [Micrococcales bacterium]
MPQPGRSIVAISAVGALVGGAVVMAACTKTPWAQTATPSTSAGLEAYYSQKLDWHACDDPKFSTGVPEIDETLGLEKLECAWLTVPLDYAQPSGETIELALARSVAASSKGSVVINPGGPGGSGVEMVPSLVKRAGPDLVRSLDVVGFDPRGVGRSAPVDCVTDDELDAYLSTDYDTSTAKGVAQAQAAADAFAAGCGEHTGALLGHVDTISAARDIDILREALGDDTLTYLGFSYGTQLGATYASLFPDKVGRMVLDGAVDPTVTPGEKSVVQAGGFESALRAYVTDCLTLAECPLSGSVDEAMAQVVAVVDGAEASPLPTGTPRPLTGELAMTGIIAPLYDKEDGWGFLTMGLTGAIKHNDGSVLLLVADLLYNDRCHDPLCSEDKGFFSNSTEAHVAIRCADARDEADPATVAALNEQIMQVAPTLGKYFVDVGVDSCAAWPTPVVPRLDSYAGIGAGPIVVIGTTNDPATPYEWAVALSEYLDEGVLVTYKGEGHTAYLSAGECVQSAVDDFLVNGKLPSNGLTC